MRHRNPLFVTLGLLWLAACSGKVATVNASVNVDEKDTLRTTRVIEVVAGDTLEFDILSPLGEGEKPYRFICLESCPPGMVVGATSGRVTWATQLDDAGYNAISTIGYTLGNRSEKILLEVNVRPRPLEFPPLAEVTVSEGAVLTVPLVATAQGAITFGCGQGCPVGAQLQTDPPRLEWTPQWNQTGSHSITLLARSGEETEEQVLHVSVTDVPHAPLWTPLTLPPAAEGIRLTFPLVAFDADHDPLTFACSQGCPGDMTVDPTSGLVTWTPGYSTSGTVQVRFTVTDGQTTVEQAQSIAVANTDREPVLLAPAAASGLEGSPLSIALEASDPDGDALTMGCLSCPSGAQLLQNPLRFSWTPAFDAAGTYTVTLIAGSNGKVAEHTLTITIAQVSHAPILTLSTSTHGGTLYAPGNPVALQGVCSQRSLALAASGIPGAQLSNQCESQGLWSAQVTLSGASGTLQLTATDPVDAGDTTVLTIPVALDATPPQLALLSPVAPYGHFTDATSVVLSGSCSTDVVRLTASTGVTFTDSSCADGTWSALYALGFTSTTVQVSAFDAADNAASVSLAVTRQIVLGQVDGESVLESQVSSAPFMLWADANRLVASDNSNHRVLIWNSHPTSPDQAPDVILGQANRSGSLPNAGGAASARTLSLPRGVHWDGSRFYVADGANNRLLIWDHFPTSSFEPAQAVLGQTALDANGANIGGVSARTLSSPHGVWWVPGQGPRPPYLFVADRSNSRVLAFNTSAWTAGPHNNLPPSPPPAAAFALGQPALEASTAGIGAARLNLPIGIWSDGSRLAVTDYYNHRVLVWDAIPESSIPADRVLGQADFTSSSYTALDAKGMPYPTDAIACGGKFFVTAAYSRRILVWNSVPGDGGFPQGLADADRVLGPANATSTASFPTTASTWVPSHGLACSGTRLYAAEYLAGRILWWNVSTLSGTGAPPDGLWSGRPAGVGTTHLNSFGSISLVAPQQQLVVGSKLIVADTGAHRVLIWNALPTWTGAQPDVVLGQASFMTFYANPSGSANASSMSGPVGLASNGTNLMVSDSGNNRILVWNTIPATSGTPADFALGQADLVSSLANRGGAVAGNTLKTPSGLHIGNGKLFVADSGNNRVLIWDTIPSNPVTDMGIAAQWALGHTGLTIGTCNRGATPPAANSLCAPNKVFTNADGKLAIADTSNSRVLIFNTIPSSHGPNADIVLGQSGMTTKIANDGGTIAANTLSAPSDLWMDNTRLAVADSSNHRVLLWNTFPTGNKESATAVVGQGGFGLGSANAFGIYTPKGVFFDGTRLWVSITSSNIIRSWNSFPAGVNQQSDAALPSAEPVLPPQNLGNGFKPGELAYANGKLYASDGDFHRLVIWNGIPGANNTPPDAVWGQADKQGTAPNRGTPASPGATSLFAPCNIGSLGSQGLVVADRRNHRVLGFATAPSSPADTPSWVLGQMDFLGQQPNWEGVSRRTLSNPYAVTSDGTRVAVADSSNHRVLLWNSIPAASGLPADVVLGQASGNANAPNGTGTVTAATLWGPQHLVIAEGRLFVADTSNRRVLIWNSWPTSDFQPADVVLGQPDAGSNTINAWGAVDDKGIYVVRQLMVSEGKLYVSDTSNNRVLVWNSIPTQTGQPADMVLGQPSFSESSRHAANPYGFLGIVATHIFQQKLFLVDWPNSRILIRPVPGGGP